MFGFVQKLFGNPASPEINADPFGREAAQATEVSVAPCIPVRAVPSMVLLRDEILDARSRIVGYRFAVRFSESDRNPDAAATVALLSSHKLAAFAQRRMALIPVTADGWLTNDYSPLMASNTVFLLISPPTESAGWGGVVARIRHWEAKVAVPVGSLDEYLAAAAGVVDYVVLDFSACSLTNVEQAVRNIRKQSPDVQFIVENVGSWAEFRYCISLGVACCLGSFTTAQDEVPQRQEIGQSRLVLIEMLNQLRNEADLQDIAEVAKRDPGVVVKIISMANSPMVGLNQPVTSVDQAIMVLGREQLYRWLAIGMFCAGSTSPRDEMLLELALARGRFLEMLGQEKHSKLHCDELFLLGLLSLLDCLLGVTMIKVVEKINLSPALNEVLLTSSGPLGRYLMLAIAVEKGQAASVGRLAQQLDFSLAAIDEASVEAIIWAEEAVRQTNRE